jgi:hypothetical protein
MRGNFPLAEKENVKSMSEAKPVKCQKCGKPVGYIKVVPSGFIQTQRPVEGVKILAVCMNCREQRKFTIS